MQKKKDGGDRINEEINKSLPAPATLFFNSFRSGKGLAEHVIKN